jgi:hypothetical protein
VTVTVSAWLEARIKLVMTTKLARRNWTPARIEKIEEVR